MTTELVFAQEVLFAGGGIQAPDRTADLLSWGTAGRQKGDVSAGLSLAYSVGFADGAVAVFAKVRKIELNDFSQRQTLLWGLHSIVRPQLKPSLENLVLKVFLPAYLANKASSVAE